MSAKSDALEAAAMDLIEARTAMDGVPGARASARVDRAFARLAALARPRIRHFTRTYGLADFAEDAEQAGAIALHRACEHYDPARARFTTYVNWQIRAELQSLRHRLRGGSQRGQTMLSLDALAEDDGGDWLADPGAEAATEQAASNELAALVADRLVAEWAARREAAVMRTPRAAAEPARSRAKIAADRMLVRRQLAHTEALVERLGEADRHTVRRAFADMTEHAARKPH